MIARMRDVAARANVSVSTVSIYLNRPDDVGTKSAKRIAEAIEELGFVRNAAASQLRRGTSRTVAFIAFDVGDPFTYMVARGARRRAAEAGLRLVMADTEGVASVEDEYLSLFEEERVRGVLLASVNRGVLGLRTKLRVPLVMIDHKPVFADVPSVSVDNLKGGALAAGHLIATGRKRLAFVGGPMEMQQIEERIAGARLAVELHPGVTFEVIDTAERTAADGVQAAEQLLARAPHERPDGVFCVNDTVAVGLMQRLQLDGSVSVPRDIAVIGYNDSAADVHPSLSLSSIRQPHESFGSTAVDLLLARAEDPDARPSDHVIFEPELIVRGSSAPPAG